MKYWSYIFLILFFSITPIAVYAQDVPSSRVDVLWESPDSYTPPFYKGKGLPSDESTIRVTAISESFNPKTTTYTWTHNGKILSNASGINKTSFIFTHNIFNNTEDIGVSLHAGGEIGDAADIASITPGTPSLVVYEKRDGMVDYTHGYTNTFDLKYAGTTLRVEPFFFSIPKNPFKDLSIAFTLGGDTPDTQRALEIPIIKPDTGGTSILKSMIQSKNSNWQSASLTTQINF